MPSEGLHQLMVVITTGKARLEPPVIVLGVHLGDHQGNAGPLANTMEGDLPSVRRDILEAVLQQISSSVQSPDGVVHR